MKTVSEHCVLNCLGLSQMLLEAAQNREWERVQTLEQTWRREVEACMAMLSEQADVSQVAEQLERLLMDVEEKSRALEQVIRLLQAQQQKELQQLKQAESYLSVP